MDPALLEELRGAAAARHALEMYRKYRCILTPLVDPRCVPEAGGPGLHVMDHGPRL